MEWGGHDKSERPKGRRTIGRKVLGTRVGRNLVLALAASSLLPIIVLALLSDREIAGQLEEQSRLRLEQLSGNIAEGITNRLALTANLLELHATRAANPTPHGTVPAAAWRSSQTPAGLLELEISTSTPPGEEKALSTEEWRHLERGKPLLWRGGASRQLWLGILLPRPGTRSIVWGMLDPDLIFGSPRSASAPGLEHSTCVLDRNTTPVACDTHSPRPPIMPGEGVSSFQKWEEGAETWYSSTRPLDLRPDYRMEPWRLIVSEASSTVSVPLLTFRRRFFWISIFAGVILLYFGTGLVRRNMEPLARLREATRQIAHQDFSHRVEIPALGRDEFQDLAESFNGMAHHLEQHTRLLTAGHAIDRAVLSALDRDQIVEVLLHRCGELLPSDALAIALARPDRPGTWTLSALEPDGGRRQEVDLCLLDAEQRELATEPDLIVVDPEGGTRSYLRFGPLRDGMGSYHIVPILLAGRVQGLIVLGFHAAIAIDEGRRLRARQLADRVAVALTNANLVLELGQLHVGTLTALARAIDAKSPWTAGHSERVTEHAQSLGAWLGLDAEELERLRRGGLLHDVGKIGTPAEILDKAGPLTAEERTIIQAHTVTGARILAPIRAYADVLDIVRHHHERWDGTGYPDHLTGEEIPKLARVLALADVYDALTSARPYRPAMTKATAMEIIARGSGTMFDPVFARAFAEMMGAAPAPPMSSLRLSREPTAAPAGALASAWLAPES